jgi:glycosyltransferase involved in cell wall biosynthesis
MEGRVRVLHINLAPPGKGGIERLLVNFFDSLHGDEFEISLCILDGDSETGKQLEGRGCKIWTLHRDPNRFDRSIYPRLTRLLRDYRPDIVHMHGAGCLLFGVPAARWAGIRNLVFTSHSSLLRPFSMRRAVLAGLLRLVSGRVAVSEAARGVLVQNYRVARKTVDVIYNGVDVARFQPACSERTSDLTIGFCGVFRPEKQLPLLIEAGAQLRERGFSARLLLVGDGPAMPECRRLVESRKLADAVTFAGEQSDVRPFLEQMDIFVLPSRIEAMPVALLEAMALGKTAVGSAVGGIPEIIEDGVSGLLLQRAEAGELAAVLARLLDDQELRQRLAAAARRRVEEGFSLNRMMSQYADLYRRLQQRAARFIPAVRSHTAGTSPAAH